MTKDKSDKRNSKEIVMERVNVEEIMEEIRAEIKKKGLTDDMLSFNQASPDTYSFGKMKEKAFIAWHRPVSRGIKGIIKKIFRKCLAFLVAPMAEDQTRFNYEVVSALDEANTKLEKLQKELKECKELIVQIKK